MLFGDSSMVIGESWKMTMKQKNPITKTHHHLKSIVNEYKSINFLHVLREKNKQADIMANKGEGLDYGILVCDQQENERKWIPL